MRIRELIKNSPTDPGIYQMLDKEGAILYIGKAKNLRNRLKNYAGNNLTGKTLMMVQQIETIEWVITKNESEALLLESRLIRKYKPKYNILLKDDKSFPYIKVRLDHEFPEVNKYRGKITDNKNKYFGPFANAGEVNNALKFLQKTFKLRNCTDNYFKNRQRPCLQYQIGRCSGPCVGKISKKEYSKSIKEAVMFLSGSSKKLQLELSKEMDKLSQNLQYEEAAIVRDKIRNLSYIQLKNESINGEALDLDSIATINLCKIYGIAVAFYRHGQYYGHKNYFPDGEANNESEMLSSFISQFYNSSNIPSEILVSNEVEDKQVLEDALTQIKGSKVKISCPAKGTKKSIMVSTLEVLEKNLGDHIKNRSAKEEILIKIADIFNLPTSPRRIEIFDNSHIMGSHAVGAMVVSGRDGFEKNEYRIYNVENKVGDDYAMIEEVMKRRMKRIKEGKSESPDLMIIDGGKGQLSTANKVMKKMELNLSIISMSKGVDRNAGREVFHTLDGIEFSMKRDDEVMKYLQILRDEAHNFAIKSHRKKRGKSIYFSSLDDIPGIGENRKRALLNYFGGIEAIKDATVNDLANVPGISIKVAEEVYNNLHE